MIELLSSPVVFLTVFGVLITVSVVIVLYFTRQERTYGKLNALLEKETGAKQELTQRMATLKKEVERLTNELALKHQMYDGLKGQYSELEQDFHQISQELTQLKDSFSKNIPRKPAEPIQKKEVVKDRHPLRAPVEAASSIQEKNPSHSITNLLHDLQALQSTLKK